MKNSTTTQVGDEWWKTEKSKPKARLTLVGFCYCLIGGDSTYTRTTMVLLAHGMYYGAVLGEPRVGEQ